MMMIYFYYFFNTVSETIPLNELKFKVSILVHSVLETRSVWHSSVWDDIYSVRQKTLRLVRNFEIRCCVYRSPPLHHMLSQMNPVHTRRISLSSKSMFSSYTLITYVTYS